MVASQNSCLATSIARFAPIRAAMSIFSMPWITSVISLKWPPSESIPCAGGEEEEEGGRGRGREREEVGGRGRGRGREREEEGGSGQGDTRLAIQLHLRQITSCQRKSELPQVGFEPTSLYSLDQCSVH